METLLALLLAILIGISGGDASNVDAADLTPSAGGGGYEVRGGTADEILGFYERYR